MALLSNKKIGAPTPAMAVSIIAQGTELEGILKLQGGLHVDGEFRGHVLTAERASIGTTGRITGSIKARHVLVSGRFEGRIECERLEITDTGEVLGDVTCLELVIDGGGRFSGKSRQPEKSPVTEKAAKPKLKVSLIGGSEQRPLVEIAAAKA